MITRNRKRTREDGYTQQFFETPISNCHLFPDSQQNTFFLPQNIWICVFDLLTDSDLSSTIILVCNEFLEICRKADAFLWKKRCLYLWEDKVESSWKPFLDDEDLCFRQKYIQSIRESQRSQLHPSELCSFTWGFRFKRAAGEWWATMDPYWNSNHSRQIMTSHFLPNGTIIRSEVDDLQRYLEENGIHQLRWRFTRTRRSAGGNKRGQFLKVNNYPSSGIKRSKRWGWIIQNQWVAYVYPAQDMSRLHDELENDIERWI